MEAPVSTTFEQTSGEGWVRGEVVVAVDAGMTGVISDTRIPWALCKPDRKARAMGKRSRKVGLDLARERGRHAGSDDVGTYFG